MQSLPLFFLRGAKYQGVTARKPKLSAILAQFQSWRVTLSRPGPTDPVKGRDVRG